MQPAADPQVGPPIVRCRFCDLPIRLDAVPELWCVSTTPGLGKADYLCEANASQHLAERVA